MLIFRDYKNIPQKYKGSVIAIGNFDGIHKGHKYVLESASRKIIGQDINMAVLTFEPHPIKILRPLDWKKRLVNFRTKIRLLKSMQVDVVFALRFNSNLSKFKARDFLQKIIINNLEASRVVVGEDFRFGFKREGDTSLIEEYSNKGFFSIDVKKKKLIDNNICSSSIIRDMILEGNVKEAYKYLGYFWEVEGKVVHGEARGRELGFPTANLNYINQIIPSRGIYSAWIKIEGEKAWRKGAVSSGVRPQFGIGKELLEVHILDFNGNIYSKSIRVALVDKIRSEKLFENVSDLVDQMHLDCEEIRKKLSADSKFSDINVINNF